MLELVTNVEQALQQYESRHARDLLTSETWHHVRNGVKQLVSELEIKGKQLAATRVDREYAQLAESLRYAVRQNNPPKIKNDLALWDVSQEFLCTLRGICHFQDEIDRQFRVSANSQSNDSPSNELSPVAQTAWTQYQTALARGNFKNSAPTDKKVYEWLLVHMRLGDTMPYFETWQRYLRKARRYHGCQKNTPRRGREHGSSIIRLSQI